MASKSFSKWFFENLRVDRYPLPGEINKLTIYSHILNVSDEYIHYNSIASQARGVYHHWFPLNECVGHMGINSLFGALVVLHQAESTDSHVLLHCHAGVNRSPMVRAAYYFMRTGRHLMEAKMEGVQGVMINFSGDADEIEKLPDGHSRMQPNMLLHNIKRNLLPALPVLEKFLKLLGTKLEQTEPTNRGGMLTQLKLDTGLI